MHPHFLLYPFVFLSSLFSAFVAVLYFIDEWRLKNKKFLGSKWIPLAFLKQISESLIFLSFGILSAALLLSAYAYSQQTIDMIATIKLILTVFIWLYFLTYLYLKLSKKLASRRLMLFSMVGFGLVCVMTSFCIWVK